MWQWRQKSGYECQSYLEDKVQELGDGSDVGGEEKAVSGLTPAFLVCDTRWRVALCSDSGPWKAGFVGAHEFSLGHTEFEVSLRYQTWL